MAMVAAAAVTAAMPATVVLNTRKCSNYGAVATAAITAAIAAMAVPKSWSW
jgi:hypothetical protein